VEKNGVGGPVLIIEDDRNTAALVATYLEKEGFATLTAHDGEEGLALALDRQPAFVILDLMLPRLDGWEVCRRLRAVSRVPILMLTAREEEIDRVMGLSLGADDYVVKPFSPRELVARVKAILRRTGPTPAPSSRLLRVNGLVLDPEKHRVSRNGQPVELTGAEFKLLQALMSAPGRVFSREELLGHFYEHGEVVVERVIDVHIGKLRQKIEDNPAEPRLIQTVRGFGYRFSETGKVSLP
jgi:DNA-binding response OmpR family regulator